jgi:hypothetical protein
MATEFNVLRHLAIFGRVTTSVRPGMDDKINGKSIKVKVDHYQAKGLIATQWAIWLVVSSHLDNIFPFVAELPPLFEQYSGQSNFHSLFGQSHVPLGSLNNLLISIFQSLKIKNSKPNQKNSAFLLPEQLHLCKLYAMVLAPSNGSENGLRHCFFAVQLGHQPLNSNKLPLHPILLWSILKGQNKYRITYMCITCNLVFCWILTC